MGCEFQSRGAPKTPDRTEDVSYIIAWLLFFSGAGARSPEKDSQKRMSTMNMTQAIMFTSQLWVFIHSRTWGMSRCARL